MAIDIKALEEQYFWFDEPVIYKLKAGGEVKISPVSLKQSNYFLSCVGLLNIEKNESNDIKIIQMSYLEFVLLLISQNDDNRIKFVNLLLMCLGFHQPLVNMINDKFVLQDSEQEITISAKEFDDIRRIILYQNIVGYDDSYISPDLKEAMRKTDELKNKNYAEITLERKMAIIIAHTGISKNALQKMTYRAFTMLFNEVCGEVEFTTTRPVALFSSEGNKMEHWIFKKKKDKFDGYITTEKKYANSVGGDYGGVKIDNSSNSGSRYDKMFNKFE